MRWLLQNLHRREAAYGFLCPGGFLVADDALRNDSLYEFAPKVREPDAKILRCVGFSRKKPA